MKLNFLYIFFYNNMLISVNKECILSFKKNCVIKKIAIYIFLDKYIHSVFFILITLKENI